MQRILLDILDDIQTQICALCTSFFASLQNAMAAARVQ